MEDSKRSGKALVLKPGRDGKILKETAFNDHRWGVTTRDNLISVKKLSQQSFDEICNRAKTMSKSTRKGERSGSPSVEDDCKPAGRRALLVEACKFSLQCSTHNAYLCILQEPEPHSSWCDCAANTHQLPSLVIISS
jgi:hypothetical protein